MSIFAEATAAKKPRTPRSLVISRLLAGLLVVMATAQLFEFEGFLSLLSTFGLPMSMLAAYILAGIIVVSEVFALPFLLQLPLSTAFRWVSMVCSWAVAGLWLVVSVWIIVSGSTIESIGMLGTVLMTPVWWAVFMSIALGILGGWASWGLWPGRRR
ncbi:hypothetical protein GW746_01950 [Candidatus Saccharibacteria bacterium]|nr:hypothetical protein [Candidatus Saccharibacteria bacterium]NCS83158.1 hypothetical protein [Candidatus Saccharibacteria bacterium]